MPTTLVKSTPNSRANRRTAGPADITNEELWVEISVTGCGSEAAFTGVDSGAAFGVGAGAASTIGADFSADADSAGDSELTRVKIASPSATLSPSFNKISTTLPLNGEGISILALSDSSVINGASF